MITTIALILMILFIAAGVRFEILWAEAHSQLKDEEIGSELYLPFVQLSPTFYIVLKVTKATNKGDKHDYLVGFGTVKIRGL